MSNAFDSLLTGIENESIVEWLIENGAKVNRIDIERNTAIHFAAEKGKL